MVWLLLLWQCVVGLFNELVCSFCHRYNIEQEERLATETTVLVESYVVSLSMQFLAHWSTKHALHLAWCH